MNTKNLSNRRFCLVPSTWLLSSALALALGSVACGAAPDPQGGEPVESTPGTADQQDDSDAGPVARVSANESDPGGPLVAPGPRPAGRGVKADPAPGPGAR
jgi:hypothetical protein